ncbi:MAG TPA: hypothetical protein VHW44_18735 [Pseudonocardiaceae bacterium]|nr:hypothetical protein [Pseudonocardiaceae bacterium]
MTPQNRTAAVLARLLAVDWSGETSFDFPRSRARLMKEYLRRAAFWARAFEATDQWPFFDVVASLAPEVRTPEGAAAELETLISTRIGWPSVAASARYALRWAAVLDAGVHVPSTLADPFEPLLLLFERGGGYTTEHGFVDLGGASVRLLSWPDHLADEPVVSLDPAELAGLDPA